MDRSVTKRRAAVLRRRRDVSGFEVRGAREVLQVTQRELAFILGVSRRSIVRLEQKESIPKHIAAALIGLGLVRP